MAHPTYLREKARSMRIERRLTIDQLAERLALPRSTIYYWVRDLPIPGSGPGGEWPESARRKGTRAMQRKYRLLREEAYREGVESYEALCAEPGFRDFVCLYIAEGYKRSPHQVSICNSDPSVMRLSDRWLRRLTRRPVDYGISYHADQDVDELRDFWGGLLGIDPVAIRHHRKSNSNQLTGRVWRSRHGVLTIRTNDTYLRSRLEAWITSLKVEWGRE
jgi:predicted DNA-binding transcriptional regulator AlpA